MSTICMYIGAALIIGLFALVFLALVCSTIAMMQEYNEKKREEKHKNSLIRIEED